MAIREKPQEARSRRREGSRRLPRGSASPENNTRAVRTLAFGSSCLHVSFSVSHFPISTNPPCHPSFQTDFSFSRIHIVLSVFICLPVSADSPESICREMQLNSVPYSLPWPSHGSGLKARKHDSKNQKTTKIFEADSLDLEDEDPDCITLVFMTQNASTLHVHI